MDLVRIFREISAVEPDKSLREEVDCAAVRFAALSSHYSLFLNAERITSQLSEESKLLTVQPLRVSCDVTSLLYFEVFSYNLL